MSRIDWGYRTNVMVCKVIQMLLSLKMDTKVTGRLVGGGRWEVGLGVGGGGGGWGGGGVVTHCAQMNP